MCCSRKCNGRICDRGGEGGTCLGCNRMRLLGPDFEFSHLKNSIIGVITKQPGLSIVVVGGALRFITTEALVPLAIKI